MKMGFAFTGASSPHGLLIRWVTGKGFFKLARSNHALVYFDGVPVEIPSAEYHQRVYFESFWKKDKVTGKTGVRGPISWENLAEWEDESKRHRIYCYDLPYSEELVRLAHAQCLQWVGKVGYAHWQLLCNLKLNVLGLGTSVYSRSPESMTCCEMPTVLWDLMDPGPPFEPGPCRRLLGIGSRLTFDETAPSGKYGVQEAVEKFVDSL